MLPWQRDETTSFFVFTINPKKKLTTNLSLSEGVSGGGSSATDLPKIKNKNKKSGSK